MANDPAFESDFLSDLAVAFRKRRKALSHRASIAEYAKVYELIQSESVERLEIRIGNTSRNAALLRLHAWPDRQIWLDARHSLKTGWAWAWTYDGRLLGKHQGQDVIAALEETLASMFEMDQSRTDELAKPWKALLARGPSAVR